MWLVKREVVPTQTRAPAAATTPSNMWFHSGPLSQTYLRGWTDRQIEQLYTNVYLLACAKARATDLASLPVRVGADPDKPKDFDTNHPLAKLLGPAPGGPTMQISARRMIAWTLMQYDVMGRLAWEITAPSSARRDGVPFELWPVPVSRVTPKPSERGGQWFTHYEIATQWGPIRRGLDQMLYYWRPSQNDFRQPESLLQAAGVNIAIATMQDQYDHSFLVNDARPAFVVVHEEFDRKKERNSFRRQFLDNHRGPSNAGKVAWVEASRDGSIPKDSLLIKQLGLSQKDAEFIERYENQIRAICVAMGVPLSRLADSSRRTFSNADRETVNYWRHGVKESGVELAEAWNVGLMPLVGDTSNVMWFDTTGIPELEPAPRFQVGEIPALLKSRAISINEARVRMDLAERPGFDELGLPPGADADGDPVAGPPDDRATSALASLTEWGRTAMEHLRQQQIRAVVNRAAGKRGRQADDNGASMAALYDTAYWYDQTEMMFRSLARQVLDVAYAACRTPLEPGSERSDRFIRQWAGVLTTRWIEHMLNQLNSYSARQPTMDIVLPQEFDTVIQSMWFLAQRGEVVPAEQVAQAAARLASGRDTLESVIASLGA